MRPAKQRPVLESSRWRNALSARRMRALGKRLPAADVDGRVAYGDDFSLRFL